MTRETFPSLAEWEKRVTAGTYHSKLISVQVPIFVDVTEVPDLQGKESKAYCGRKNTCQNSHPECPVQSKVETRQSQSQSQGSQEPVGGFSEKPSADALSSIPRSFLLCHVCFL